MHHHPGWVAFLVLLLAFESPMVLSVTPIISLIHQDGLVYVGFLGLWIPSLSMSVSKHSQLASQLLA